MELHQKAYPNSRSNSKIEFSIVELVMVDWWNPAGIYCPNLTLMRTFRSSDKARSALKCSPDAFIITVHSTPQRQHHF